MARLISEPAVPKVRAAGGTGDRESNSMGSMNVDVFRWVADLYLAFPLALPLARAAAVGGAWLVAAMALWRFCRQPSERQYLLWVFLACAGIALLAHHIAAVLAIPRPFVAGFSPLYIRHSPTGSLPSSHGAVMMLIALLYLARAPLRHTGAGMAIVALVTGVGRVFVGVHFPRDIGAGFLLAGLVAIFFLVAEKAFRQRRSRPLEREAELHASHETR